jgi:hypothetical protein
LVAKRVVAGLGAPDFSERLEEAIVNAYFKALSNLAPRK